MSVIRTKALILRHSTDREHDRLLTLLTPTNGQLRVRARGTKKSVSKLGGSLEPLTEVDINVADGRVIGIVTGSVVLNRFKPLHQDVVAMTMAQWLLELVETITKPEQPERGLYDLVIKQLTAMAGEIEQPIGRRWLLLCTAAIAVMAHEGFVPSLTQCGVCHRPLKDDAVSYDPIHGFVHRHEAVDSAQKLSALTVAYLVRGDLPTDERSVFREVHALMESLLHHTLDRPLKSEGVLRAVVRLG